MADPTGTPAGRTSNAVDADDWLLVQLVEPWLSESAAVLEWGSGPGWETTSSIAARVRHLTRLDSDEGRLHRARQLAEAAGLANVVFQLTHERGLPSLPAASIDVVILHSGAGERSVADVGRRVRDVCRLLVDGGVLLVRSSAPSRGALEVNSFNIELPMCRLCRRLGLTVVRQCSGPATSFVLAEKPIESIAPRLEAALEDARFADTERALEAATRTVAALGRDLAERVTLLALTLRSTPQGHARDDVIRRMRTLVRGDGL